MQTVFALTIFAYCINTFIVFIGSALSLPTVTALAIPQTVTDTTVNNSLQTLNSTSQGGFNTSLIFGDWIKPINTFIALISLQGIVNLMGNFGFPQSFILPLGIIFAVYGIGSLIYLVSGRGILSSI